MRVALFAQPWWAYGAASGVLLIATFYPFYIWPLCFVALAPLYVVAASPRFARQHVFGAAALAFGMFIFTTAFFLAVQFTWLPASETFINLIRTVGVVGVALVYGVLFGVWLVCVRAVRGRSVLLNALAGAALYALAEAAAQWVLGGYFPGVLAYAATPIVPLMDLSALGGALLVSAIIAFVSSIIGEAFVAGYARWKESVLAVAVIALAVAVLMLCNSGYLAPRVGEQKTLALATVQIADNTEKTYATTTTQGTLEFPWLESLLRGQAHNTDLFVYPSSVVQGIVAHGSTTAPLVAASEEQLAAWASRVVPPHTTLMVWTDDAQGSIITTGFQFFNTGGETGAISKRLLLRFMDYTPAWARSLGIASNPFDVVPGQSAPPVYVAGVPVGGLVCSEAVRPVRGQEEARSADIVMASASEAMFQDDVEGIFTLRTLQYRAAETNTPILRSSLLGPSALINRDGSVATFLNKGKGGILYATATIEPDRRRTLWGAYGNAPMLIAAALLCVAVALARFLGRKEQD